MKPFDDYSLQQQIDGHVWDDETESYHCLLCEQRFAAEQIHPVGKQLYTAAKAIRLHLQKEHGDRLVKLLDSDPKYVTLTDRQKDLVRFLQQGLDDKSIARNLAISPATVRYQRFTLREKAKAAKRYLLIMALAGQENNLGQQKETTLLQPHERARMLDERYVITKKEEKKILGDVFSSLEPLRLDVFSAKEKKKIVILRTIVQQFAKERSYTEKEVNEILALIHEDHVTLRRYLVEYGYLDRTRDGSRYWRP